jgi:hypothetical protein
MTMWVAGAERFLLANKTVYSTSDMNLVSAD